MTLSKIDRGSAFPPGAPPSGPERDLLPSAGDDGRARATFARTWARHMTAHVLFGLLFFVPLWCSYALSATGVWRRI